MVNGVWKCDDNAPKESDETGNVNNILDLRKYPSKLMIEVNENKDYYIAKPPADHFDINAQLVPIQFTKNVLNSTSKNKLSENNILYKYINDNENISVKYSPAPPHVVL